MTILTVDQLSVSFGGIKALSQVSFKVEKETIHAIIGPNGAGKTTLFNCITGFYKPTLGHMFFKNIKEWKLDKLAGSHAVASKGIARTFQNIRLFKDMTCLENLLVAQHNQVNKNLLSGIFKTKSFRTSEKEALDRAWYWLDFVGLTEEANRVSGELPYGHQRRLEIARAMSTKPKMVCLDEPAAGLNHNETTELSKLITSIKEEHKTTVLVIEHDMALIMDISDRIVVLDHGEVIAEGNPTEVKNNKKVIAAYLGEEE
tara:strand:- start:80 stop:856 length:777 start_codon:yes stop_codon:yes gene_type:complete